MTKAEIEHTLIAVLKELQTGAGEQACEITSTTTPLKDLGFFDSLLALETTIVLEDRLGATWNEDSVFVDKESSQPLTVAQIVDHLAAAASGGK